MKEFIEKLIARIMLESASCKVYKLINSNKEDVAEFNAYKKCIEIVNQVAEEYNNGWISVNVNMPYIGVKNDFECGYYVAWMPLPTPYKEGVTENERNSRV
jgi:hypothetical protein